MTVLLKGPDGRETVFHRSRLDEGHSEQWLEDRLFETPALVPLEEIELGAGAFIPICRQLTLPRPLGQAYLDILGVTPRGRLVLVECKLWRNPQARREVAAQIMEYAALLRRWSYADLTAKLKATKGFTGDNPIFDLVAPHDATLPEAAFVDAVSDSLRLGDFHLIIAGDGIREDMRVLSEHLAQSYARLSLVEFRLWQDGHGQTLIVPHIPFRSEVHVQRLVAKADGTPVIFEEDEEPGAAEPAGAIGDQALIRAQNRAFWQDLINRIEFDHPDQPPPRHGGNNWVRLDMPGPAKWMTLYREKQTLGMSLRFDQPGAWIPILAEDREAIEREVGLPGLVFHNLGDPTTLEAIGLHAPRSDFATEEDEARWLCDAANRMVNAFRPRLSDLADQV